MRKSKLLFMCVPTIAPFLFSINTYAATNVYDVTLPKDYSSAKITIDVPEDKQFFAEFTSEDGKKRYQGVYENENIVCMINEQLKAGDWKVSVTDGTYNENGIFEASQEINTEFFKDVHVTFEGNIEKNADVDKQITVSADIAGLKHYFVDKSIHIEWDSDFSEGVHIEVINKQNNQIVKSDTVKTNNFECAFTDISDFVIKVIPYESVNVEGAGCQFEMHYNDTAPGNVAYEEVSITNKDTISTSCELNAGSYVKTFRNGELSFTTEPVEVDGVYSYDIPIEAGMNDLTTYIVDAEENMYSFRTSVEKDVISPVLKLETDYNGIITTNDIIVISGTVEDYDELVCNGNPVEVNGENKFSIEYQLTEGENNIILNASDLAGNVVTYSGVVGMMIEEKPIVNFKMIIVFVIVACAIVYILRTLRGVKGNVKLKSKEPEVKIDEETREKKSLKKVDTKKILKDIIDVAVPCFTIAILLTQVLCVTVVQSGSMEPTLMTGDTAFFNRLYYKSGKEIERGDIVCFRKDGNILGKRVIGLPGDTIEFRDGYVVINGLYTDESDYLGSEVETNSLRIFTVPENCFFMLGDNRGISFDSRFWEVPFVPAEDIIGKYMGHMKFSIQRDILHLL